MSQPKNNFFCPVPWQQSFIATNGDIKTCVAAYSSASQGAMLTNGTPANISNTSISASRNHSTLTELRKNMLANCSTPEVCQRCYEDEKNNLISRRKLELMKTDFSPEKAHSLTSVNGTIKTSHAPLRTLDLKLGNLCNLSCRMCHPSQSSGWYNEWSQNRQYQFQDGKSRVELKMSNKRVLAANDPYAWPDTSTFWSELEQYLPDLQEIHFSGGEPLLIAKHHEFLNTIVQLGHSHHIELTYNTNLTVLPQWLLDLWKSFRYVHVGVSVDAWGDGNDYIRYPSTFSKIYNNLERLNNFEGSLNFWLTTTVTLLNIGLMADLVQKIIHSNLPRMNRDWKLSQPTLFLSYHVLRQPSWLAVSQLPIKSKKRISNILERQSKTIFQESTLNEFEQSHIQQVFTGLNQALMERSHYDEIYRLYIEIRKSDLFRKQSLAKFDIDLNREILEHLDLTGQLSAAERMIHKKWGKQHAL